MTPRQWSMLAIIYQYDPTICAWRRVQMIDPELWKGKKPIKILIGKRRRIE